MVEREVIRLLLQEMEVGSHLETKILDLNIFFEDEMEEREN